MRRLGIVVGLATLVFVEPATGDDDLEEEPDPVPAVRPIGDGSLLVGRGATWRYQAFVAPRLDRHIGAVALAGLDLVRGRRKDALDVTGPAIATPDGWPHKLAGKTGAAPFGAADSSGKCDCTTRFDLGEQDRVAAFYGLTSFTLSKDHANLRVLELRVRYRDGIVVWLNGTEVVRRGLDATALATKARGPEWETFRIPAAPSLLRAGQNQLAVIVRPSGRSRAPLMELELVGRRRHGIARGPIVQRVGATSATIVVETDLATPVTLRQGKTVKKSPAGKRHVFELAGLPAKSAISYRVEAGDETTPDFRFHTAPAPGEPVRIAVYGDVRGGHATHRSLVDAIRGEAPDLVIATGDLVLRGSDEGDWQRFFAVTADLLATVAYYPAIGNHDLGRTGDEQRRAEDLFALPAAPPDRPDVGNWYAFDVGDVHLVMLDSNNYERAEQRAWLERDLADARKRKVRAIIVSTHDGPYSRGQHRGNEVAQRDYVPIMTKHKVDVVLSGHDHHYQRGTVGGLDYIVTGGGGASLYGLSCGAPGKRACKVDDGMQKVAREHHYLMVTIDHGRIEMCPRRADGSAVEACIRQKLKR